MKNSWKNEVPAYTIARPNRTSCLAQRMRKRLVIANWKMNGSFALADECDFSDIEC